MEEYRNLFNKLKSIKYYVKSNKLDNLSKIGLFETDIEQSKAVINDLEKKKQKLDHVSNILNNYIDIKKNDLKKWAKVALIFEVIFMAVVILSSFKYFSIEIILELFFRSLIGSALTISIFHYIKMYDIKEEYQKNIGRKDEIPRQMKELEEELADVLQLIKLAESTIALLQEQNIKIDNDIAQLDIYLEYLLGKIENKEFVKSKDETLQEIEILVRKRALPQDTDVI